MTLKQILEANGITLPDGFDAGKIETELVKMYKGSDDGIPYDRFQQVVKERNELKGKVAEFEVSVTDYENKITGLNEKVKSSEGLQSRIAEIEKKELTGLTDRNSEILKKLNIDKDNKNYEKVSNIKADFTIKEEGKEYTKEELTSNIKNYEFLTKTGFFEKVEVHKVPGTPPKTPPPDPTKFGSIADMITNKK